MRHASLTAICRFTAGFAASSLLVVLATTTTTSAYVTGSIPASKKCSLQHKVAVKAGKAIAGVGKCYVKAAKALCRGEDRQTILDDLDSCKADAKEHWIGDTDKLKKKNPDAPLCLTGADVAQVFDDLDTVLQRAANLVACEGVAPLIGNLSGHEPSDCDTIGEAELKVLKKVKALARKLAFTCLHGLCVKRQDGKSFDLAECVDRAQNKFLTKAADVKHVPQCLLDNAPEIADGLAALLSADADVLFCESGAALDPSGTAGGCCQGDGFCTPATSSTDCDSTFRSGQTCDEARTACVPPSCGITDHLACSQQSGDTCFDCEIDCCPPPSCGNQFCDPGENASNCPEDCFIP